MIRTTATPANYGGHTRQTRTSDVLSLQCARLMFSLFVSHFISCSLFPVAFTLDVLVDINVIVSSKQHRVRVTTACSFRATYLRSKKIDEKIASVAAGNVLHFVPPLHDCYLSVILGLQLSVSSVAPSFFIALVS